MLFRKPIWRIRIARYFGRVIFLPAALCSHYAFGSHACRLNLVGYVERPVGQSSGDGDGGLCIEANGKRGEQYRTERLPDDLIDHNISFRALRGNRACLNAAFRHGDHLVANGAIEGARDGVQGRGQNVSMQADTGHEITLPGTQFHE